MKRTQLFQFNLEGIDQAGPFKGMMADVAITDIDTANKMARSFEEGLAQQEPEKKIKVTAVGLEDVGPRVQQQMQALRTEATRQKMTARLLAARLAERVAKDQLELAPNLPMMAERLLWEAGQAAEQAMSAQAQRQAGLVLGADGKPALARGRA